MVQTHYCRRPGKQLGFTAIELLVVIGIIVLLGSLGALFGFDAVTRSSVHSERDLIVTLLTRARTRAIANIDRLPHGLLIDADEAILFAGSDYASSDPASRQSISRNNVITVTGLAEIVFDQLSGNSLTVGAITLTGNSSSVTIDINNAGRIDW